MGKSGVRIAVEEGGPRNTSCKIYLDCKKSRVGTKMRNSKLEISIKILHGDRKTKANLNIIGKKNMKIGN
jgi:hypothetical protein